MEACQNNREVVSTIGDLVEVLFSEMEALPLSDPAKQAMVMIMLGDVLKREGWVVHFQYPPELLRREAAA